jgi:hypothetical protein
MNNEYAEPLTEEELEALTELYERTTTRKTIYQGDKWFVSRPEGKDAFIAHGEPGNDRQTYDLIEGYDVDTDYEWICQVHNNYPRLIATIKDQTNLVEDMKTAHGKLTKLMLGMMAQNSEILKLSNEVGGIGLAKWRVDKLMQQSNTIAKQQVAINELRKRIAELEGK